MKYIGFCLVLNRGYLRNLFAANYVLWRRCSFFFPWLDNEKKCLHKTKPRTLHYKPMYFTLIWHFYYFYQLTALEASQTSFDLLPWAWRHGGRDGGMYLFSFSSLSLLTTRKSYAKVWGMKARRATPSLDCVYHCVWSPPSRVLYAGKEHALRETQGTGFQSSHLPANSWGAVGNLANLPKPRVFHLQNGKSSSAPLLRSFKV